MPQQKKLTRLEELQLQRELANQPSALDPLQQSSVEVQAKTPTPVRTQTAPNPTFMFDPKKSIFDQAESFDPTSSSGQEIMTGTQVGPPPRNETIDILTPIMSALAAAGVGGFTRSPTAAGAAYTGTNLGMQKLRSEPDPGLLSQNLGLTPGGIPSMGANVLEQAGLGKLTEAGMRGLGTAGRYALGGRFGVPKAPIEFDALKYRPTTSQAIELIRGRQTPTSRALSIIESLSPRGQEVARLRSSEFLGREGEKLFESLGHNLTLDMVRDPDAIFKVIQRSSLPHPYLSQATHEVLDNVFQDTNWTKSLLSARQRRGVVNQNLRADLGAARFATLMQRHSTPNPSNPRQVVFDFENFSRDFHDPKYAGAQSVLYSGAQKQRIEEFIRAISITQRTGNPNIPKLITGGGIVSGIVVPGVFSAMRGDLIPSAIGGGVVLTANQIGRLLTKDASARVLTNMIAGKPLGMPQQLANIILANGLNGMTIMMANKDGEIVDEGTVQNRKFTSTK